MPFIGKLIYGVYSEKSEVERLQATIREAEWQAIVSYIPKGASFLDVGCGAGYAMQRALEEKQCTVVGIDPEPGAHGVGRYETERISSKLEILQGHSEQLPFEDESFDVVYSSHVLEHVNDEQKTLQEMKRVLKPNGVLIIGMPTATMAWINLFSQLLFTTHIKVYEFFRFLNKPGRWKRFFSIFRIYSHSAPRANSIWYDIGHYRASNWRKLIEKEWYIEHRLFPLFYLYPNYIQFFNPYTSQITSSSVIFICSQPNK